MLDFKQFSESFINNDYWDRYTPNWEDVEKVFLLIEAFEFYKLYDKSDFDFDQFCNDYWNDLEEY